MNTPLAYTDEQQIDELVSQIIEDYDSFDDNETDEILADLDDLLAQILADSWYCVPLVFLAH